MFTLGWKLKNTMRVVEWQLCLKTKLPPVALLRLFCGLRPHPPAPNPILVTLGYPCLPVLTLAYPWLPLAALGAFRYPRLPLVTLGYSWLVYLTLREPEAWRKWHRVSCSFSFPPSPGAEIRTPKRCLERGYEIDLCALHMWLLVPGLRPWREMLYRTIVDLGFNWIQQSD